MVCLPVGEGGVDTLVSGIGAVLKASLRCKCEPFAVCRSLWRVQRSARTNVRVHPGWSQ
jgi:hypothetical protein